MSAYTIKPVFNAALNQIAFPSDSLNVFMSAELQDTFGFYQSRFGVYGYMKLTKKMQFKIHTLSGSPLMWQPHKTCGWDPTGSLQVGIRTLEPCNGKINEEFCYDELFDSCYEHFLSWDGSGPVDLDSDGIAMVNQLVNVIGQNATIGARTTLTAGQLYDVDTVEFNEKTPANIRKLFDKTVGTCQGWVELLGALGTDSKYSHLNVPNIFQAADFDGKKYTGDVIDLFDELFDKATPDLQRFINEGGLPGIPGTSNSWPLFMVSTSVHAKAAADYKAQCISTTCLNPRLGRETFQVNTDTGTRPFYIYSIDQIPLIPVTELNCYDTYLTGATHLAAITISGNIQLGASFDQLPDVGNGNIGLLIEQSKQARNYGVYYFLAHSLFATTIANTDMIVATQAYGQPAALPI